MNTDLDRKERISRIKAFWDSRARQYGESCQATLAEIALRKLEIRTMNQYIKRHAPRSVLDVGCGNGFSTIQYAQKFKDIEFYGIDYSSEMIKYAQKRPMANCSFDVGDVLNKETLPKRKFDFIISQRCLQNLPDYESQFTAIHNLLSSKTPQGKLLLMEGSKNGVAQLNQYLMKLGRPPINNIEPWHNNFLIDERIVSDFHAEIDYFSSTYMFLEKVLNSRLSKLGYILPSFGKFGYVRLYMIR